MSLELFISITMVAAIAIAWVLRRRRVEIHIDENGILVAMPLAEPLCLSWDEVHSFGVASVCEIEGGLCRGFSQYVGVRLNDSSGKKPTPACANNRKLSDYDILLTPDHGMSVERFAAFLESEKAKFKKRGQKDQFKPM